MKLENKINHLIMYEGKIINNQEFKQMLNKGFEKPVEIYKLNEQNYRMN